MVNPWVSEFFSLFIDVAYRIMRADEKFAGVGWLKHMKKIILLQTVATIGVAVISALFGGGSAAISALLSGIACTVPNALFALNMSILVRLNPTNSAFIFMIGEFIKLIAIAILLVVIVMLYEDLVWPAMLFSIIVVLNCSLLGLLTRE